MLGQQVPDFKEGLAHADREEGLPRRWPRDSVAADNHDEAVLVGDAPPLDQKSLDRMGGGAWITRPEDPKERPMRPRALASGLRATQQPSLLDRTTTGRSRRW